jgi:hypothetical protein
MFRCGPSAPSSSRTRVATIPERAPLVSHIFWPLTTNPPSGPAVALVVMAATSDPTSGSDIENAPFRSPAAIRGRSRVRCSGVPCRISRYATMKWVLMTPDTLIQPREICSTTSAYVSSDSPSPPYSSGIISPNSPISAMVATICSG